MACPGLGKEGKGLLKGGEGGSETRGKVVVTCWGRDLKKMESVLNSSEGLKNGGNYDG